ncbi:MAG: (Fe-S)-binding protein [Deltaproteobacteria bacterium]|nr:(Fe-S)-binding protein [Deltaproteobacteria bacterium]MBW2150644.1 (Fe-S)-binding protein [Deltaproteobacteria bacterium]
MEAKYDFERKFREQVLKCSRCGFCQAHCPVFGATLRPAYNARGKMLILKEVMEGKIDLNDELIETLFQCTMCANCFTNCPSGVEVAEIIKCVRRDMVNIGSCHPAFKGMNEVLKKYTNIYAEEQSEDFNRQRNRQAEYVFFIGCVGAYREEESTTATLDLLDRLNINYTLIDEVCCSGVLEDVGFQINENLAKKNIERILTTNASALITGCPYCARTFNSKPQYDELKDKGIKILHISQLLKDYDFDVKTDMVVTYHDPCDLGRHCGIFEEPRQTIRKITPNFVEMPHNRMDALCCGAGGGVRGAYAKNSIAMARRRLQEAEAVGAQVVLTECNSCVHNLSNAKLRRQKFEVHNTTHFIIQLLEGK